MIDGYDKMIQNSFVFKCTKNKKQLIKYKENKLKDKKDISKTITKDYKQFNVKYIVSGNIIERYCYEVVREKGVINNTTGRNGKGKADKKENRKKILQRAKNTVRRLINANEDLKAFITLTYRDDVKDIKESNKKFKQFIQRINDTHQKNFKYVAVIEFQDKNRDGVIHYHMICNWNVPFKPTEWLVNKRGQRYRRKSDKQKEYEQWFESKVWKNGFVDIRPLTGNKNKYGTEEVDNVGAYICKYMTSDLDDLRLCGKKAYLNSKNLNEPIEIYVDEEREKDVLQNVYNLNNRMCALESTFNNDFTGKIEYKQYNLSRNFNINSL